MVDLKRMHKIAGKIRKAGVKKGDTVTYNVVTERDYYNVSGVVKKVHKDGTFDVDTGMVIDKRVSPENVALGMISPANVIRIKKRLKKIL